MDTGYVILLLLGLVYGATAIFLYVRAKQVEPGTQQEAPEMPPEAPEAP